MRRGARSDRIVVIGLLAATAAFAAPYALAGPNFILDDWFSLRNARFDGAFAAAGGDQLTARPGAWLTYGVVFGLIGNHPLPVFVVQTAVAAAVAVALFAALRRFVDTSIAAAVAGLWVVLPVHTSIDNWASALNIGVALLLLLLGVVALGRDRSNVAAAVLFAVSILFYEATLPAAALATVALPVAVERRRPRWRELAAPAVAMAATAAWIVVNWHPAKRVDATADLGQVLNGHFGWGVVRWAPVHRLTLVAGLVGCSVAAARLIVARWRSAAGPPELLTAAGLAVIAAGAAPFARYFYAPVGAGDRVMVVSAIGAAMVWVGVAAMAARAAGNRAAQLGAAALFGVFAVAAAATNVARDLTYARAGDDVLQTVEAIDRAFPEPGPPGPIALGPRPLQEENIVGLLDTTNVDGVLQVHRGRTTIRGYVTQSMAEWLRAPPHLRFDQRPIGRD